MAHGFRLAGANAVMMTLWKVSDETAPEFMAQFYRTLLNRQQARPDEPTQTALRITLRDTQAWAVNEGWSYWDYAPFVLVEN
jgi:CHAT domain-containing protein